MTGDLHRYVSRQFAIRQAFENMSLAEHEERFEPESIANAYRHEFASRGHLHFDPECPACQQTRWKMGCIHRPDPEWNVSTTLDFSYQWGREMLWPLSRSAQA